MQVAPVLIESFAGEMDNRVETTILINSLQPNQRTVSQALMNDVASNKTGTSSQQTWLKSYSSRYFLDWLAGLSISLAFTTYQTGKLFFVGRKTNGSISMFERTYGHCMGMWASPDGQTIWLSSRYQIWRMTQAPAQVVPYQPPVEGNPDSAVPAWADRGYDVAYIPRVGYTTGHLDVHDMAVDANGRLI